MTFDDIFRAELDLIARRRAARGAGRPGGNPAEDLIGLSLSGGGIRSAAFHLGLLQALGRSGVLGRCDYLSTVSGGGYIGSSLQALCSREGVDATPERFPFQYNGRTERAEIQYLRRHGEYLAPRHGPLRLDTWRLISTYLGGLVLTLLTVYALLAGAAAIGIMAYPAFVHLFAFLPGVPTLADQAIWSEPERYWVTFLAPAIVLAVLWAALSLLYVVATLVPTLWTLKFRSGLTRAQGICLMVASIAAVFGLLPPLFSWTQGHLGGGMASWGVALQGIVGLLGPVLSSGAARTAWPRLRRVVAPLVATLLQALVILIVVYQVWLWHDHAIVVLGLALLVLLVLALTTDVNRASMHYFYRDRLSEAFIFRRRAGAAAPAGAGGAGEVASLETADDLRLTDLRTADRPVPYPLINATVNLPGSDDLALRGRKADFFLMSPLACGSPATGFVASDVYEDGRLTLASAMAVSGAAANPQQGHSTRPALAFLMTLLNVRLGFWAVNPALGASPSGRMRRPRARWPVAVARELFSVADERDRLINISDGGHLENLGLYELLKRRCRVIVASDAGADPDRTFGDLGNVMRLARIDLGIQITIEVDPLRPETATGLSTAHVVRGTIRYPKEEGGMDEGTLFYLKTALTRDDPRDLHEYRAGHPEYPHESTLDQFFDEAQFESYRELGYQSGRALRDRVRGGEPGLAGLLGIEPAAAPG